MGLVLSWNTHDNKEEVIELTQTPMMVGSLLSNQIVISGKSVDPIHALLEEKKNTWLITDLGSTSGVWVNGEKIVVEKSLKEGDRLKFGDVEVTCLLAQNKKLPVPPVPKKSEEKKKTKTNASGPGLFSNDQEGASGETLEVIAYWGGTILNVEHFGKNKIGFHQVTIGDPTKAHFVSAGEQDFASYVISTLSEGGHTLHLIEGMSATLRRGGKMEQVAAGVHPLSKGDFAKVQYGPVSYFFLFMSPPVLDLPRTGPRDPFFLGLSITGMVVYLGLVISLFAIDVKTQDKPEEEDIWSIVNIPDKKQEEPRPEPIETVKVPPPPTPLEPPPKPVEPVPPKDPEVVKKPPPPPPPKAEQVLTKAKTQPKPEPGGGLPAAGGEKKEAEEAPKPVGVNLSTLGVGLGKISSKKGGAGAIQTNFTSSPGGAKVGEALGIKIMDWVDCQVQKIWHWVDLGML